jgi:signal transduction histidine kinase
VTRSSFRSIDRQVTLGFSVALAIIVSVMAYARARVVSADRATEWVDHTHHVLEAIATVRTQIAEAQAGQRDYLLTGEPARLAPYRAAARSLDPLLTHLRALTTDNVAQQRRLDTLAGLSHRLLAELGRLTALADIRGRNVARDALMGGPSDPVTAQFQATAVRMDADERRLLGARAARQVVERHAARIAVAFGALVLLTLAAGAAVRLTSELAVRARAESERDAHAHALALQSREVEAQNEELIAQGEALKLAMDQVEGANHAKSMFLAQMSHELRTPLNSVIGFANIVRRNPRGALNDAELTYLDRIAENGRQLLLTINSILDLSKIHAEQESVELEMVSLDVLVGEVLAQMEPQAAAGQVVVAADLPTPLASIVTDTEKLRRVLINLVANAIKFTRAGGQVVVRVETGQRAPMVPVAIEVRDTGVGIAPERLTLIFEAFEQGDVGVGREYGGTGLGLSISRALCRLLHCELTVSSVLAQGSVFRIVLPLGGAPASLPPAVSALHGGAASRV